MLLWGKEQGWDVRVVINRSEELMNTHSGGTLGWGGGELNDALGFQLLYFSSICTPAVL